MTASVLPPRNPLAREQKRFLLLAARKALEVSATGRVPQPPPTDDPRLLEPRGAFVTLRKGGDLRGCIGHFGQDLPLAEAVVRMTWASARHDPRFEPVELREVPAIAIVISALTPLVQVRGPDDVVIGRDGVRVSHGGRDGTLLPQVALEQGWDAETLLTYACEKKARLPADAWRHGATIETYGADVFGEDDPDLAV